MFSVRSFSGVAALALVVSANPVAAQSLPGLENFSIDQSRSPAPVPTATATPRPTPSTSPATAATPVPTPSAAPSGLPRNAASPAPAATRSPTPAPAPSASPRVTPTVTPTAVPTDTPGAAPAAEPSATLSAESSPSPVPEAASGSPVEDAGWPWWWLLAGGVTAAVAAFAWSRRQRTASVDEATWAQAPVAEPLAEPVVSPRAAEPAAPPPVVPVAEPVAPQHAPAPVPKSPGGLVTSSLKPSIQITVQPTHASVDSLRVGLDYVVRIANTGQAPAFGVTMETWLFGAGSNPQAELDELLALPPGQPQLPPFDLVAGAQGDLAAQSLAPRETLAIINAGERRMVVPMLAIRARYLDRRGQEHAATAAFLIGVERDGQARLAPLALDRGSRAYDRLGIRTFGG